MKKKLKRSVRVIEKNKQEKPSFWNVFGVDLGPKIFNFSLREILKD